MYDFTEKIHGSNGSVCYSNPDGMWAQSRERIITIQKDTYDIAQWVLTNENELIKIVKTLADTHNIDLDQNIISCYFERCGAGIQKLSAMSGVDRTSIMFAYFKVSPILHDPDIRSTWYSTNELSNHAIRLYNVNEFKTYKLSIDFKKSRDGLVELNELLNEFESNSPVGQYFEMEDNILEGFVGTYYDEKEHKLIMFKHKGELHGRSTNKGPRNKKVIEAFTPEQLALIDKLTPEWRLEQMFNEATIGDNYVMNRIPVYIKMVLNDIEKEEMVVIQESGIVYKVIEKEICNVARTFFVKLLNEKLMTEVLN